MRLLTILLLPAVAAAQRAPAIALKPADATLAEEFTRIGAVRELRDGRVLITDSRENRLVVADFGTGRVEQVGRTGSGPGEYRNTSALIALANDSTLFPDFQNRRWHLLDGAKIVVTLPPETPVLMLVPGISLGADRNGRILTQRNVQRTTFDPNVVNESLYVVLADRATGRADSIARIRPQPTRITATGRGRDGGSAFVTMMLTPLTTNEQPILMSDGWIAIARLDPYRVDWRTPDGKWVHGATIPFKPVRLDDREQRAYMERNARASGRPVGDPSTVPEWPATIAPFERNGLLVAPDGRLVIQRIPTADAPPTRYDVVDRRGRLTGTFELPASERIAGFGVKSVYVAVTDDDGIQRLRRHPWPAERPVVP